MVLGGGLEFSKFYNKEIVERPSDDKEVPSVSVCVLCSASEVAVLYCCCS